MCTGDLLQFHVPGAYRATPTLVLLEQSSAAGPSAEGSGCQGGRGHLGPARPAGQASPNLSPGLSSPGPEGSRSEGGGGGGAASAPHLREAGGPVPGSPPPTPGLPRGRRPLAHPSCPPPAPAPPRSRRRQLAARCRSAGPPGPLRLSPPRSSAPFSSFPAPAAGLERGAPPPPTPGRARREGGDCGEGGAPPASRGLERAWPGSRRRRAGTHSAARRARTRLAPLGARAAQRMLAGCPGLGPRSRPGGPRVRP